MEMVQNILIVEDSESDALLTFEALNHGLLEDHIFRVKDGEEALRFVFRKEEYSQAIRPSLILLDLNMPGTDGREVLQQIRRCSSTQDMPVIVMTSSPYDADILSSQGLEANAYIVKPVAMTSLTKAVNSIGSLGPTSAG